MVAINFEKPENKDENEIVPFEFPVTRKAFSEGGAEHVVQKMKTMISEFNLDVSTKEGRKAIRGVSAQIASTKVGFDKIRKALNSDLKTQKDIINNEWKYIEEAFNNIKIETRAPLTAWEQEEALRKEEIKRKNAEVTRLEKERLKLIEDEEEAHKEDILFNKNVIIKKEQERIALEQEAAQKIINERKKEAEEREDKLRIEREDIAREKAEMLKERNALILDRVESLIMGYAEKTREIKGVKKQFHVSRFVSLCVVDSFDVVSKDLKLDIKSMISVRIEEEKQTQEDYESDERKEELEKEEKEEAEKSKRIANDLKEEDRKKEIENQVYSKLINIAGHENIAQSVFEAIKNGDIPNVGIRY